MKSWICIENCGACCKFDLNERTDLAGKLNKEDISLIRSMTAKDGWCKNLDRVNKKCLIYENSFNKRHQDFLKNIVSY